MTFFSLSSFSIMKKGKDKKGWAKETRVIFRGNSKYSFLDHKRHFVTKDISEPNLTENSWKIVNSIEKKERAFISFLESANRNRSSNGQKKYSQTKAWGKIENPNIKTTKITLISIFIECVKVSTARFSIIEILLHDDVVQGFRPAGPGLNARIFLAKDLLRLSWETRVAAAGQGSNLCFALQLGKAFCTDLIQVVG